MNGRPRWLSISASLQTILAKALCTLACESVGKTQQRVVLFESMCSAACRRSGGWIVAYVSGTPGSATGNLMRDSWPRKRNWSWLCSECLSFIFLHMITPPNSFLSALWCVLYSPHPESLRWRLLRRRDIRTYAWLQGKEGFRIVRNIKVGIVPSDTRKVFYIRRWNNRAESLTLPTVRHSTELSVSEPGFVSFFSWKGRRQFLYWVRRKELTSVTETASFSFIERKYSFPVRMFLTCVTIATTGISASCLCLPNGPDEAGTFAPTHGNKHRTTFCNVLGSKKIEGGGRSAK
jgi:hypothetical protein